MYAVTPQQPIRWQSLAAKLKTVNIKLTDCNFQLLKTAMKLQIIGNMPTVCAYCVVVHGGSEFFGQNHLWHMKKYKMLK